MSQSLSATITIHNPENKPKPGGMCVANHTSAIDVPILSTQTTFSLVMRHYGDINFCFQNLLLGICDDVLLFVTN